MGSCGREQQSARYADSLHKWDMRNSPEYDYGAEKQSIYHIDFCGGRVHVENDEVVKSYEHNHVPDNAQVELKELMYNMKHDAQTSAATSHGVIGNLASQCGGRVHVENDEVVKSYEHNHVPDNAQVELKELMYNMKHDAQTSAATSHGVIGNLASQVPLSVAGQLPSVASLKRTIQRARRTKLNAPVNPLNFSFDIPEDFTKTKNGDDFLLFDNKSDTKRILLFSTKNSLELMNNCLNWFCDGTFTCSPIPFKQLYTIHAVHYSNVIPSAYALLPDKKEDTYIQMFKALKSLNQNLNPKSIMMDFEKAAMNAVKSEFPNTSINGCFFHLSQCIWRHLQEAGLQKNYIQDSEFALHIRMLPALAFVPQNKVIKDYEKLLDSEYFSENEELLMPIIDYFEGTWIGRLHRRGQRRDPIIPISVWNCYDLVAADLPRTNNSVEGWHNCFSSTLNSSKHPSIWRFIHALQKEESINTLKIQQYVAGQEPPSKKIYKNKSENLKKNMCRL
ncbi:uncharacterized protein LOC107883198 [Acyrthosiphon pisum]|uniref:MULE transposase domain-containing protein n=1 Tax=Acyrthosiphon pisum TaxID=7029 RepID=A0A8R2D2Z3_ACYPI|nr:uncharacterized protein LOC107883198 [Acyrthosiphon pisum]